MIAGYCRVSTLEQATEGYSIGEQQQRLRDYCSARGWAAPELYTDAGCSGGNIDRPALQELVRAAKRGKIDKVLVYKLDRLSRSQKDTLELIEDVFIPNNVSFISISENFDTSTPFGLAIIGILSVFAQLERNQIKERMTVGREARAKEGKYHGGSVPPIGYDYIDGRLVVNRFESMEVREVFKLYTQGYGYTEIADTLNSRGWRHKYGAWIKSTVSRVLSNSVYIGLISFGGAEYEGDHEAIVETETFNAATIRQQRDKRQLTTYSDKQPLMGILWCKRCGRRYTHTATRGKYFYFRCMSGKKCDNRVYKAEELNSLIYGELRKLTLEDIKQERGKIPDPRGELEAELEKIDKQRSRLLDLYALGSFAAEEIQAKVEPLNSRRAAIEAELDADPRRDGERIEKVVLSIADVLEAGDMIATRQLVRELIDRIEIDGDDVEIHWNFK